MEARKRRVKKNYLDEYKLCYIANGTMFFTDNFAHQWGDDWDDPYSSSGEPYEHIEDRNDNEQRGHLKYIGFVNNTDEWLRTPWEDGGYSSVKDINRGVRAWHWVWDEFGQRVRKCNDERNCKRKRKDAAEEAYEAAVRRSQKI